jgi:hypothetical protein
MIIIRIWSGETLDNFSLRETTVLSSLLHDLGLELRLTVDKELPNMLYLFLKGRSLVNLLVHFFILFMMRIFELLSM